MPLYLANGGFGLLQVCLYTWLMMALAYSKCVFILGLWWLWPTPSVSLYLANDGFDLLQVCLYTWLMVALAYSKYAFILG